MIDKTGRKVKIEKTRKTTKKQKKLKKIFRLRVRNNDTKHGFLVNFRSINDCELICVNITNVAYSENQGKSIIRNTELSPSRR